MLKNKRKIKVSCEEKKGLNETGFTLIEVVLVLLLVGGVFLALTSIFAKMITDDKESSYEIIASGLAQEGVEIIKNRRDWNFLNGKPINDGLLPNVECYPAWEPFGDANIASCTNNSWNKRVGKRSSGSRYINCHNDGCTGVYPGGATDYVSTIYTRECNIQCLDIDGAGTNDCAKAFAVSCVVEWEGVSGITRKARAMAILTAWQ